MWTSCFPSSFFLKDTSFYTECLCFSLKGQLTAFSCELSLHSSVTCCLHQHTVFITVVLLRLGTMSLPTWVFFNIVLVFVGCFHFNINIRISFYKMASWDLNLQIKLGKSDISTILSLPIHRHRVSLHLFRSSWISFSLFQVIIVHWWYIRQQMDFQY